MIGYRIRIGKFLNVEYLFAPNIGLFDLTDEWDLESLAEMACEDFRENHDGWECWKEGPVELELFNPSTEETLFRCRVNLEFEPSYEVWEIEQ